jgi:hypothetical protein
MAIERWKSLLLRALTALAVTPAVGQTPPPAIGAGHGKQPATASILDFSGSWRRAGLPWFEPPVSGPGPVTNWSRKNGVSNYQADVNREQMSEIRNLRAKLADNASRATFDLQEKCAAQAARMFHDWGYDANESKTINSYQNHYSQTFRKCFISIDLVGFPTTNKFLVDLYEQRTYASYTWIADKEKKYWEVPPRMCTLVSPLGNETFCKSQEEYDAFVATYME